MSSKIVGHVQESQRGPDTIDNAIVLCLRCHGEVGHYNPKHPIGNKYTSEELVNHRDNWYSLCERNPLIVFGSYPAGESPQKLIDEGRWPALRSLLMQEIEQVRQSLGQEELHLSSQNSGELEEIIGAYETFCGGLAALFMILCQNYQPQCIQLAVECLEKIANSSKTTQQPKLHLFPALLTLYAGGIAAILAQNFRTMKALLYDVRISAEQNDEAAMALTAWSIMDRKYQGLVRGQYQGYFPLSYRLCEALRQPARQYVFMDSDKYEECFDKFEYFHNLAHADLSGPFDPMHSYLWPPLGYFVIRRNGTDFIDRIEQDIDRQRQHWPPLLAGFVQSDFSRLVELIPDLHERIKWFYRSQYCLDYRTG